MAGASSADDERLVPPADLARFWERVGPVGPGGCQDWTGTLAGEREYGVITFGDRRITASRLAYAVEHGEVPQGAWVLHTCDRPICVAPPHLYLGDQLLNEQDKAVRRRVYGERHPSAKLTAAQVAEARAARAAGARLVDLAQLYGMTSTGLHSAISGRTWRHEPMP